MIAESQPALFHFTPVFAFIISYGMGYLLGSIPFGLILTKLAGIGDIRQVGSGNIGATNVLRAGGKKLAALTLVLDALKGVVAVMIGNHYTPTLGMVAGAAALLGHSYPVWLKYKGGKGVATGFGMSCAINLPVGLAIGFTWTLVLFMVRYSSVAALSAAALAPFYGWLLGDINLLYFYLIISSFIFWRHRLNIRRLLNGTEPSFRFGGSKAEATQPAETPPSPPQADNGANKSE